MLTDLAAKPPLAQPVGSHPVSPALRTISQADRACPSFQQCRFSPCSPGSSCTHLMVLAVMKGGL